MKHCQISDEIASRAQSYGARDFNPLKYKGEGWTRARKNRAKNTFSEAEKTFLFVNGKGKKQNKAKAIKGLLEPAHSYHGLSLY